MKGSVKSIAGFAAITAALSVACVGAQNATAADALTIRWSSAIPATTIYSKGTQRWADEVAKRTNGRVKVETFFGGALFKAGEELEGIRTGLVDGGLLANVYYPTRMPLHNVTYAVPFGPSSALVLGRILYKLYEVPEFVAEAEQYNQKLIFPACILESYDLISRRPVRTLDDLKGKKTATIVQHGPMLAAAGAVPVNIAATERYMAMQTGVIDAMMWGIVSANAFKLHEVGKSVFLVDFGASYAGSATINMDVWKKISPQDQTIILDLGREATESYAKETDDLVAKIVGDWKSRGIEVNKLSEADKRRWSEALKNLPANWGKDLDAKGKTGSKVLKAFVKAAEEQGYHFPYKVD